MTLDMLHADAVTDGEPVGLVTSGGTGSIAPRHARLPRARRGRRGASPGPTSSSPRPAHPAFDKACHLFGIELRTRAGRPGDHPGRRRRRGRRSSTTRRSPSIGSACNYGYGTIDPIEELSDLALERGVGLHVDGCLGGFILPWGQELGYDIPVFDFRLPGRHQHLGRHPQVRLRLQGHVGAAVPRQGPAQQPVLLPDRLDRRQVLLAGHGRARRSGGLLAATWAAMVHARPRGLPAATPSRSSRPPIAMQDAVRSPPRAAHHRQPDVLLQLHAPTSSTSTTSTTS